MSNHFVMNAKFRKHQKISVIDGLFIRYQTGCLEQRLIPKTDATDGIFDVSYRSEKHFCESKIKFIKDNYISDRHQ